ncbi:phosphatidylethanolamine-binding protein [Xylaria arbuscula]|nr:phosphatidylethanolamine-binding protein [Xylaria arbuscula]
MRTSIVSALILAGVVSAQTPAGFVPAVTEKLEVTFGSKNVETGGQPLTKTDTARQPTIGLSGPANGTYIWMLIDLDAYEPRVNEFREPQGWNASDVSPHRAPGLQGQRGSFSRRRPVSWFAPAPAAETPPHPHRYTNLLWEQPSNWQIPSAANTMLQNQKLGFDVTKFITAAGLSNPIAANYFNETG